MITALVDACVFYVLMSFGRRGMGRRRERASIPDDDHFSKISLPKLMNLLYEMLRFLVGASKLSLTDARVCYMLM